MTTLFESYFRRFGFCGAQIALPPHPDLGLAVVIPCFHEPDLIEALESLWACSRPSCAVEAIVVINRSADSLPQVQQQNEITLRTALEWVQTRQDSHLTFHLLNFPALPPKQAGVGLARKIGMDEAARRLDGLARAGQGVIACFDADCRCDPNYLVQLEVHFRDHPNTPGCSIYFEHPLEGRFEPSMYEAITLYELQLRYHVQALRHTGFPYGHHTVGSSMAARADAYMRQGGMNKRQAAEDFYFLQKLIPLGGYTDLVTTRVMPSPRLSDRVPFGTGRAVGEFLQSGTLRADPLPAFLDLKQLFLVLDQLQPEQPFAGSGIAEGLSLPLRRFLAESQFEEVLSELRANTASLPSFRRRFFRWCNAFTIIKFLHYARPFYPQHHRVQEEAAALLQLLSDAPRPTPLTARDLLGHYRRLDQRT